MTNEEKALNAFACMHDGLLRLLDNKDSEAKECFENAKKLGHPYAEDGLTIMKLDLLYRQYHIVDLQNALNGDVEACYNLGQDYESGFEMPQSYENAARWYLIAANQGHAEAQCNMGWMYYSGNGVRKDMEEAIKWYRKAAENGDPVAMVNLSDKLWRKGLYTESTVWAERAWNSDNETAHDKVDQMEHSHIQERYDISDDEDPEAVFQAEAMIGNRTAMFSMAILNQEKGNEQEAFSWFMKCAEFGPYPQYRIALCYHNGIGVPQSHEEAVKWYSMAAKQGLADAQYDLGLCYYNGEGVTQSLVEAVKWFIQAAEQGHQDAIQTLDSIEQG